MGKYTYGWCSAESRPHKLSDFTSRQKVDKFDNIYNITVCRLCGKRPSDDD